MKKKHSKRGRALRGEPRRGASPPPSVTGKLSVAPAGFGFVSVEDDDNFKEDIFVPAQYLGAAMDGDTVQIDIIPDERRPAPGRSEFIGRIRQIIVRHRKKLVGRLLAGNKIRPLSKKIPDDFILSGSTLGARRGDWLEAEIIAGETEGHQSLRVSAKRNLGPAGNIENDLDAIIAEYDLPPPYSVEEDAAAAKLEPRSIDRVDLTDRIALTIDPVDAKDFDDAISWRRDGENIELGVHIADVAAWIEPGSRFDRAARDRGFTAYLPGKTMPMLPKTLTAAMSLTAGEAMPAHSVLMSVNPATGEIEAVKRFRSRVKIAARLSFAEVEDAIAGEPPADWSGALRGQIANLAELAAVMRVNRAANEQFLELATEEIRVLCDEKNKTILGLSRKKQGKADQLVEEFMLAANSAVADELLARSIPGVFRIHPEPDPAKLEEFSAFVFATFKIRTGDLSSRTVCNEFLANLRDDESRPVITSAFLRALNRAGYSEANDLHFGLGKYRYSHFTSPIRRYSDLSVHQQLWNADINAALASGKSMATIAAECTEKEKRTDEAYFAANDRLKLHYLRQILERDDSSAMYEGVIAKISSAGLVVDIHDIGIYGFVPKDRLGGAFRYSKQNSTLAAIHGHRKYRCGDFVFLRLADIDFSRGSAVFAPVS